MPVVSLKDVRSNLHSFAKTISFSEDDDENKEKISTSEFHQLIPVLNVSYYLCVSPFRIRKDNDGTYKIHTHLLQKILTMIFNLLVMVFMIKDLVYYLPSDSVVNEPKNLFKILANFLTIFFVVAGFFTLWKKSGAIGDILNISQSDGTKPTKFGCTLLIQILLVLWITHRFTLDFYYIYLREFNFQNIIQYNSRNSICRIFRNMLEDCRPDWFQRWSTPMQILAVVYKIFEYYHWIVKGLVSFLITSAAFVVYQSSKSFDHRIKKNSRDITKIYWQFQHVRNVVDLMNSFIGPLFMIYIFKIFCEHIHDVFGVLVVKNTVSTFGKCHYFGTLSQSIIILLICAEANRKMNKMKDWLTSYRTKELTESDQELPNTNNSENYKLYELLKMQTAETEMGLGFGSLFTVSYTSLATLFGVFATYAVIQLQFHSENAKDNVMPPAPKMIPRQNTMPRPNVTSQPNIMPRQNITKTGNLTRI